MPELSADLYGTVSHKLDALQPSGIVNSIKKFQRSQELLN